MNDTSMRQLTPSQKEAVCHKEGPLLILAGPGSGKTRVITYRIAALIESGVRPFNICAITFTNKAAEEMRQRAFSLGTSAGAHISTFHSLCVRILRKYANEASIKPGFTVYDDSDQTKCVKEAVKSCYLDSTNFSPARMLNAISTLKNKLISPESFKEEADDFFSNKLSEVYCAYQNLLAERNGMDFDDLLMKTAFLLKDFPDVCTELNERFKYLLIDEYQDTNHAQYIISRYLAVHHNNICATGDPDQSIYRWRGADINNILAFEKDFPNAKVIKLQENFRSSAGILEKADKLIACNQNRKDKVLVPVKKDAGEVIVSACDNESSEAQMIAQRINELTEKGYSLREMAVFYRVNSMSRTIEEAFISNNIPYQIVRGVEFYRRKEIRDLLAYLKILVNPDDEISLVRIINTPTRGVGKVTIDKVKAYSQKHGISFYGALGKSSQIDSLSSGPKAKLAVFYNMLEQFKKDVSGKVAPLAQRIFTESGLEKFYSSMGADGQTALENANELIGSAAKFDEQAENATLVDYLQQISLFSDADAYDSSNDCIALMTLHAAKGLEFENVFIIGLEDGILPHERANYSDDEDELEEERRLFFVGITRAKTGLYISYSRYRTIRGQFLRTVPSQFLSEIDVQVEKQEQEEQQTYEKPVIQEKKPPEFVPGQLVRHNSFGLGRIKRYVDMGQNSMVLVQFNTGQTKSLMLKYANLSKVDF